MKKFLTLVCLSVFLSCTESKEQYIENFSEFITELDEDCLKYDDSDWEKAEKTYKKFTEEKYKKYSEELTLEDIKTVAKLRTDFFAIKVKYNASKLKKEFGKSVKEAMDELKED